MNTKLFTLNDRLARGMSIASESTRLFKPDEIITALCKSVRDNGGDPRRFTGEMRKASVVWVTLHSFTAEGDTKAFIAGLTGLLSADGCITPRRRRQRRSVGKPNQMVDDAVGVAMGDDE